MTPHLVMFDFDGVITHNSETITYRLLSEFLHERGMPMSADQVSDTFCGWSRRLVYQWLEEQGLVLSEADHERLVTNRRVVFETELRSSPHLDALLLQVTDRAIPYCIATNGKFDNLAFCLPLLRLDTIFPLDRVFTSEQFGGDKAKLYAFVAETNGFAAQDCMAIEDSVTGMSCATAANIGYRVGYIGAMQHTPKNIQREHLLEAGAHVVVDDLAAVIIPS